MFTWNKPFAPGDKSEVFLCVLIVGSTLDLPALTATGRFLPIHTNPASETATTAPIAYGPVTWI